MSNRSDTFNRTDAASLGTPSDGGSAWIDYAGSHFSVESNRAKMQSGGTNQILNSLECSEADGDVQVTIAVMPTADGAAVMFRCTDVSNFYEFDIRPSGVCRLYKIESGGYSILSQVSYSGSSGDVLKVNLSGSAINCYINAVLKVTQSNAFNQTATKHGIWTWQESTARWDDWSFTGTGGGGGGGNPYYYYRFMRG